MSNDTITNEDAEIIETYLAENGYADLDEWGVDSDYLYDDEQDEWFDGNVFFSDGSIGAVGDAAPKGAHRLSHPLGNMVDLRVQLLGAIDAAEQWDQIEANIKTYLAEDAYGDRSDYSDSDLLAEAITLLRWAEAEMEEGEVSRDIGRFLDMVTR